MAKTCDNDVVNSAAAVTEPKGSGFARKEVWARTATELAVLYRAGETSPAQVLEEVLGRIEAVNPVLNAIVTLDRDGAREAAHQSGLRLAAGKSLGLLDGIPITVKDNLFVGGLRATWGSRLFEDLVPDLDDRFLEFGRLSGILRDGVAL